MFLLDTNVFSELRKAKPHGAVLAWIKSVPPKDLFVSAMVIAEIQVGIERIRANDVSKAIEIEAWLLRMVATMQVISMDLEVARTWAKMMQGRSRLLAEDTWIAATAKCNRLIIATRNVRDFEGLGVDVFNPFEDMRAQPTS
jgi:toxin FitB